MKILLVFVNLMVLLPSYGQVLTGRVQDFKTGKFLKEAEVFVDRSMKKVVSDENGFFTIEGLEIGATYKVGCVRNGYRLDTKSVTIAKEENIVLFILIKDNTKRVRNAEKELEIISSLQGKADIFPGWVDSCFVHKSNIRTANDLNYGYVEFHNTALGYSITCYLNGYNSFNNSSLTYFKPLRGDQEMQMRWEQNRFLKYKLTTNYFLESVLQNTTGLLGIHMSNENSGSVDLARQLSIGYSGQTNALSLGNSIQVIQKIDSTTFVSRIGASTIIFNDAGYIINRDSVTLTGAFASNQLSSMLPDDYEAPMEWKSFRLEPFFEKAYVHADKPYYYPGDTLWFKAYMNYKTLPLIGSLSTVLYVELFERRGDTTRLIDERILKIEDGLAWGEFILSDTLSTDFIALRAYTNLQRNYSDGQVFHKVFPLVRRNLNIRNSRSELITDPLVTLYFDKPVYNTRSRITGTIIVMNEQNQQVPAWMSVSVTDRSMVRLIHDSVLITSSFAIKPFKEPLHIRYPLERGLTLSGQFLNFREKPVMVELRMMSVNFPQAFEFTTNGEGRFSISGLEYYDSIQVKYTAKEGKFSVPGMIIPDVRTSYPFETEWPTATQLVEVADYKIDKNTTMLKEVIVEGKKAEATKNEASTNERFVRPFGEPDYILSGSQLNPSSVNVIEMLRGRVPGLDISFNGAQYGIRFTRAQFLTINTAPAVFIDDGYMGGPPQQALLSINPADVAAIEITTRLNSLLGALGANGVISVYTKSGGLRGTYKETQELRYFSVKGYTAPARFSGVDHSNAFLPPNSDFRTTLFWSPSINSSPAGAARFQFYSSDSEGPYLITIEGVTSDGRPFHHEVTFEISDTKK